MVDSPSNKYYHEGSIAVICDDQNSAKAAVDKMKTDYGDGISTKILVENATGQDLIKVTDTQYSSGKWQVLPAHIFGNKKWMACLHVHISGTATGSTGSMTFEDNPDFICGWDTPFSGENLISGGRRVKADFLENESSVCIRYILIPDYAGK